MSLEGSEAVGEVLLAAGVPTGDDVQAAVVASVGVGVAVAWPSREVPASVTAANDESGSFCSA